MSDGAHLLHVFSTFVPAGPETRTVRLIEALGAGWRHSIVAVDGRTDAAALLPRELDARVLPSPPRAGSLATVRRLRALLREERPDLVLSYNWGAFDAVIAARSLGMRRLVHHEDGFDDQEIARTLARRVRARRWLLSGVARVVVPSRALERVALETWRLPRERVLYVPNGVRLERYAPRDGNPGLRARLGIPADALVVGFVGHLRPVKNPLRFLKACARVDPELPLRVLVLGEGPEKPAMEALAARTPTLYGKVVFAGYQPDPAPYYRAMDLYALSSDSEQMPVALVEAMASALPVVATDVGDVRAMLPDEQAEHVVALEAHETAWPLAERISALLADPGLRRRLGEANRARALERYSFERMLESYRGVYRDALAR